METEKKEKARILFDAKKNAGLHKSIIYDPMCGLSKQEWELDNLADEIITSNSSLERIGILKKFIDNEAADFLCWTLGKKMGDVIVAIEWEYSVTTAKEHASIIYNAYKDELNNQP